MASDITPCTSANTVDLQVPGFILNKISSYLYNYLKIYFASIKHGVLVVTGKYKSGVEAENRLKIMRKK